MPHILSRLVPSCLRVLRLLTVGSWLALLAACGGSGGGEPVPAPIPTPVVPTGLTLAYGVKSFSLTWGTAASPADQGPVTYRVYEDTDGAGPSAPTMIAQSLTSTSYAYAINGLLHTRVNAQYTVQACNNAGCSASAAAVTPNLIQAIGYIKPSTTNGVNLFGDAVALSADGSTLAVGARGIYNTLDLDVGDAGVVHVFTRTGSGWAQQAVFKAPTPRAGDNFGIGVALSSDGSTLAIGMPGRPIVNSFNNMQVPSNLYGTIAGNVFVYARTGGSWTQQAALEGADTQQADFFGRSVALSGDGNTLAVGATSFSTSPVVKDAVHVFNRTGSAWAQRGYIDVSNSPNIEGPNIAFGNAVALSTNGDTLAVGAPGSGLGGGAVYVFRLAGSVWEQQAFLREAYPVGGMQIFQGDQFGISVALSADGNTMAVGALGELSAATGINGAQVDSGTTNFVGGAGAVFVFTRSGSNWSQQAYVKASNTKGGQYFGSAVTLSSDGNILAVGAPGEASAANGINGNQADVSAGGSGATYLYGRNGSNWAQQAYVKASNRSGAFGTAVALTADGNTMAVGARFESSAPGGAVYIY